MTENRRQQLGRIGEQIALEHYMRLGYRLLERNFRTARGELDLIVCDRRTIVFAEVKTRSVGPRPGAPAAPEPDTLSARPGAVLTAPPAAIRAPAPAVHPLESVGPRKQRRLRALAGIWLAADHDRPRRAELRFDAVGVLLDQRGRLIALEQVEIC